MKWIDNVGAEIHRLWSLRVGLFFFVLNGAVLGLAAFVNVFNPWFFLFLNMVGYGLMGLMRLLKQAPVVDVEPKP